MAEPPSEAGAVKVTLAWPLPATAVTPVGRRAPWPADRVDGAEAGPVPTPLVAVTVKV